MREVLLAVIFLGVLVFFHELGHFLVGKKFNVFIHEFSMGFGPKIFSYVRGHTRYSIRAIPVGGYVRFAGEEGPLSDEDQAVPEDMLFSRKSPGKKALILGAGPFMNLLVAFLAFFIVFSVTGVGKPTVYVGEVVPGYPAAAAGIQPGDKVVGVEGIPVKEWQDMVNVIQKRAGIPTKITLERNSQVITVTVTPIDSGGQGVIGVRSGITMVRLGIIPGLLNAMKETVSVIVAWVTGILGMILGKVAPDVTGPVGISQLLGEAASMGASQLIYLVGALSANLGLINLLPIPALDGSRLIFTGIEALRGKPIDPEKESLVHFLGFIILMAVFAVITYKDILRLIR